MSSQLPEPLQMRVQGPETYWEDRAEMAQAALEAERLSWGLDPLGLQNALDDAQDAQGQLIPTGAVSSAAQRTVRVHLPSTVAVLPSAAGPSAAPSAKVTPGSLAAVALLTTVAFELADFFRNGRYDSNSVKGLLATLTAATAATQAVRVLLDRALKPALASLGEALKAQSEDHMIMWAAKAVGRFGLKVPKGAYTGVAAACGLISQLFSYGYYRSMALIPGLTSRDRDRYRKLAGRSLNLDYLVGSTAVTITSCAVGGLFGGPFGLVVSAVVAQILDSLMADVLATKNDVGGWKAWFAVKVGGSTAIPFWGESPLLDLATVLSKTPDDITCPITQQLVVDPVRFVHVGFAADGRPVPPSCRVYERQALYRALRQTGRDPYTNLPARRADYRDSPAAKEVAQRIATEFGASVRLDTDS